MFWRATSNDLSWVGIGYGEGFSAVSHDWDTKTPVCGTSLDKGLVHERLLNQVGVATLNGEYLI